jgi:hypothetical protein
MEYLSTKFKAPSSKQIPMIKNQIQNFVFWYLVIGAYLELGIWCLGFH